MSLLDTLLKDHRLLLDSEWVNSFLKTIEIFAYEIVKIKVSDLKIRKFTNGKFIVHSIKESPALEYLRGNKQQYINYCNYKNSYVGKEIHSIERFDNLIKSFKYDEKISIVIDENNIVLDGQHRASLYYNKNKNTIISVLKIYANI